MSPPSINGTVLHQLCYAIWLSKIFISCVKTDSLWSLTQAVQRSTTSHQHSLSWLHLGASCFTATLRFESGCLMLLGGEELFSAKSCKRLYWLCLVSYGLFRFFFFLFLQQSHHTQQCWRDTAPDCKSLLWNSLRCISIYSLGWWKVDVDFFSWNLLLVTLHP